MRRVNERAELMNGPNSITTVATRITDVASNHSLKRVVIIRKGAFLPPPFFFNQGDLVDAPVGIFGDGPFARLSAGRLGLALGEQRAQEGVLGGLDVHFGHNPRQLAISLGDLTLDLIAQLINIYTYIQG